MEKINLLKNIIKKFKKEKVAAEDPKIPIIIPASEHHISQQMINQRAVKVLKRLTEAGFNAYLVGGCVRDLLLGLKPKDFDVATDARPDEIRRLFKNCRLIGKRFRLAHIFFGPEIIEVATFRSHHGNAHEAHAKMHQGMIVRDNVYGSIEDDVLRRDFRINALYYSLKDAAVIDYVGGMDDLRNHVLHMIGDAEARFHEDPVRLLRAVRFLAKLNFQMTPETEEPLNRLNHLLQHVSSARLYQEILKLFHSGSALQTIILMKKYKLFSQLFPQTALYINNMEEQRLLDIALANTDQRIKEGKIISIAFLFSVFLWHPFIHRIAELNQNEEKLDRHALQEQAIIEIIKKQTLALGMTRQVQTTIREICLLQHRFHLRRGKQPYRLLNHPRFRAALDLLLFRAESGETAVIDLAKWWTRFQDSDTTERVNMLNQILSCS